MKFILVIISVILLSSLSIAQEMKHTEGMEHNFAVKELEKFHDLLRPLVHVSLEKGDFETIRAGLDSLYPRAVAIQKAKLPKKFANKKKEFQKGAKLLVKQLANMTKNKKTMDNDALKSKFEEMHETFESLTNVLTK